MMWRYGYNNGGWGWGGMILMLLFWAVIIGLIIWGVARMSRHGGYLHHGQYGNNALDIARERYAKGEISQEEFEKIKRNLS